MWGVIRSVTPTSLRSTELMTLARFVESRDWLVMKGMFSATMISASLLFCVSRWGDERMFRLLFPCDARRTAAMAGTCRPVRQGDAPADPAGDQPGPREDEGGSRGEAGQQGVHAALDAVVRAADDRAVLPPPDLRRGAPLHPDVQRLVEVDLHDHRLDEDLAAPDVELLDDPHQRLVVVRRRDDDQGVGGLVRRDLHPALELGGDDGSSGGGRRRRGDPPARGGDRGGAGALLLREGGEDLGHLFGVRVFEVVDVDPSAAGGGGDVDLFQQVRHVVLHLPPGVHDHAVGAGIRQNLHRDAAGGADTDGAASRGRRAGAAST